MQRSLKPEQALTRDHDGQHVARRINVIAAISVRSDV